VNRLIESADLSEAWVVRREASCGSRSIKVSARGFPRNEAPGTESGRQIRKVGAGAHLFVKFPLGLLLDSRLALSLAVRTPRVHDDVAFRVVLCVVFFFVLLVLVVLLIFDRDLVSAFCVLVRTSRGRRHARDLVRLRDVVGQYVCAVERGRREFGSAGRLHERAVREKMSVSVTVASTSRGRFCWCARLSRVS
jgi:hypothetical protein